MHIKSNIEHNVIDVVILAICPLILVMNDVKSALYYIIASAFCILISSVFCLMLNKYLSRIMKVFITAVLSTFLITILNYFISEYSFLGLVSNDRNYYAILSTIVMSIDLYYIDTKATVNHYFLKVLSLVFIFGIVSMLYITVKEFLSLGTVFGLKVFDYSGYEFFKTTTFNFIWLALVCVVSQVIYRSITKIIQERRMAYAKILKQIRNEKVFQYDMLRRKKLLASDVEMKFIDSEEFESIKDKENELIPLDFLDENESDSEQSINRNSTIKRKKSKLKVSKEAKVQRVFDRNAKGGRI